MFIVFFIVVAGIAYVFAATYNDPSILIFALIFSVVYALISYYSSAKIALSLAKATPIQKSDNPELYNIVENLCITAGLPMPKVYVTPELQINAFATGRDPKHAAIAVTQGALQRLDKDELQGVIGHELSHVGNRDILVSTVAAILAGIISLIADIFLRSIFSSAAVSAAAAGAATIRGRNCSSFFAIALSISRADRHPAESSSPSRAAAKRLRMHPASCLRAIRKA